MSEEQLKAFLEKVKGDTTLQGKLKAAKTPRDIVGIAREHGYEFTADKIAELSEEELESVAGGAWCLECIYRTSVGKIKLSDGWCKVN